jgi:hypothetical protein
VPTQFVLALASSASSAAKPSSSFARMQAHRLALGRDGEAARGALEQALAEPRLQRASRLVTTEGTTSSDAAAPARLPWSRTASTSSRSPRSIPEFMPWK